MAECSVFTTDPEPRTAAYLRLTGPALANRRPTSGTVAADPDCYQDYVRGSSKVLCQIAVSAVRSSEVPAAAGVQRKSAPELAQGSVASADLALLSRRMPREPARIFRGLRP